ncbi:MAG: ATP-binding cassette domain-containing protein [Campylobacterota bacterium]|nr:ATP-binding cassette domain-containing protein [Campylobacterota bacterium]
MLKLNNYSNYILKDISLEINSKNLIILGSNGAGKTTLAQAFIDTKDLNDTKLLNYIPNSLDIFDEFITVSEFLKLSSLHSTHTIDEVLEKLEINYLKDKSSKHLSSGESQLVLVASAILHNAKYTILDEPTSALDPKKIKMVYKLLNNNDTLKYKIIITHNLNLAYKLGYDILFIEDGKIKFNGTNNDFFDKNNLIEFFENSVIKTNNNILVDL